MSAVDMLENGKSTHKVEVVPVVIEKHPNADKLGIVQIWGYTCCVNLEQWQGIKKAAYIVPDTLVDVKRPEFSFLAAEANSEGKYRVKAKKLRGVVSYGLLVPVADDVEVGSDLSDVLGTERYEPEPLSRSQKDKFIISGDEESGPSLCTGPEKYDVDSLERYAYQLLTEGEPVTVCEKLDGMNARFVYFDNRYWVKTRNRWVKRNPDYSHVTMEFLTKQGVEQQRAVEIIDRLNSKESAINSFWKQLEATPVLEKYLRDNPGVTVFGEIYGNTNRLKYGLKEGNRFAAFDVWRDGDFVSAADIVLNYDYEPLLDMWAPIIKYSTPYSFNEIKQLATGKTTVKGSDVIREGVVVRPIKERREHRFGRVILKSVNPSFLEMK